MCKRGMYFNADMVRAVLYDSKTQTRRVVNGVPSTHNFHGGILISTRVKDEDKACWAVGISPLLTNPIRVRCPFSEVGDRLWVRETFAVHGNSDHYAIHYRANHTAHVELKDMGYRPSIHITRWASRITLEITGVRVERSTSINDEDSAAERYRAEHSIDGLTHDAWLWFRNLWDGIYSDNSIKANPWVWIIEFKRVEAD